MTTVDRPLFIVGPHRSGTTLLYELLADHPEVGYMNRFNKRLVAFPRLAHWLTAAFGPDKPMETQPVWDRFKRRDDDVMQAADATARERQWYTRLIATVLRVRGATRFLAKYPRLSLRLPWLDALFPDAIFIHVVRDWRATVNSTVNRKVKRDKRGGGWFGVFIPGWQEMGSLSHERAAAEQYRYVTLELENAQQLFPGRVVQVHYEDLCAAPCESLRRLAERTGLSWPQAFRASLPECLESANFKWQERLDEEKIADIQATDEEFYRRFERT